jgi:hypothetical protein
LNLDQFHPKIFTARRKGEKLVIKEQKMSPVSGSDLPGSGGGFCGGLIVSAPAELIAGDAAALFAQLERRRSLAQPALDAHLAHRERVHRLTKLLKRGLLAGVSVFQVSI